MKKIKSKLLLGVLLGFCAFIIATPSFAFYPHALAIPSNAQVSAASTYTISFVMLTADTIAKIVIAFDPGFTLDQASVNTYTGITSGTLSLSGDTFVYSITYPDSIPVATSCTITLQNIINASVCASTYSLSISTKNNYDTLVDDIPCDTFALLGNSLKITTPAQVLLPGETSSLIQIIACDASGNTDLFFNDSVTISSSSASGKFAPYGTSWTTVSDTYIILSGGTGNFFYMDTAVGVADIIISREDYTGFTQQIKIVEFMSEPIACDTTNIVVISSATGSTTITIPVGTFSSTFTLTISETPTSTAITSANNSTRTDPSLKLVSELGATIREISVFAVNASGNADYGQPLNPSSGKYVTITIPYPNSTAISGSSEDGLRICRLDETTQGWILLSVSNTIDKTAKTVSCNITSFSFYRLISYGISSNLSDVIVYPNPFKFANARDGNLKFINLPQTALIKIYNIAGELVRTISKDDTTNRALWNGKNDSGDYVASGIYIYVISSSYDTKKITGKIAVIASPR